MNNQGFVLPTVLAFIIITSGIVLYQSVSLIGQLYSLQSSADDLQTLEYAVNTRRVIDQYAPTTECSHQVGLEYQQTAGENYTFAINCIYTETDSTKYNQYIAQLLTNQTISSESYNELIAISKQVESTINQNQVEVNYQGQTIASQYEQQLYLGFISFDNNVLEQHLVIFNQDKQILSNIIVK